MNKASMILGLGNKLGVGYLLSMHRMNLNEVTILYESFCKIINSNIKEMKGE